MIVNQAQSLNSRAEAQTLKAFESWPTNEFPAGYFEGNITPEEIAFFQENGYLVRHTGLSAEELEGLRKETAEICAGEHGKIRGFIDGTPGESYDEAMKRYLCIHFPHKVSGNMRNMVAHPAIVDVLTHIISPNVKCMQSMLFIKSSGKPGQAWHQDEFFIPTRDRSLTGGWIALDDATVENGCLWVIPGSHKPGVLYQMQDHNDLKRFDCTQQAQDYPWTDDDAVPVEVKAGSIVFFNGYLLHRSLPNHTVGSFRRALVNHYMSAESLLPWFEGALPEGQPLYSADNRDIVLVAGKDPYAYKGIENRNSPHVRPSGMGGCGNQQMNEEQN